MPVYCINNQISVYCMNTQMLVFLPNPYPTSPCQFALILHHHSILLIDLPFPRYVTFAFITAFAIIYRVETISINYFIIFYLCHILPFSRTLSCTIAPCYTAFIIAFPYAHYETFIDTITST